VTSPSGSTPDGPVLADAADLHRPAPVLMYLVSDVDAYVAATQETIDRLQNQLERPAPASNSGANPAKSGDGISEGEGPDHSVATKADIDRFTVFLDGLHEPS